MEISLNGKKTASNVTTLMDLVLEQGIDPEALIAEVNFEVIPQENWNLFALRPGDTIELLSFVGGG